MVIGRHKDAMVRKAVWANCSHLFKNSYKNIILEIQRNSFLVTASDCSVFSSLFLRLPAVPIKLFFYCFCLFPVLPNFFLVRFLSAGMMKTTKKEEMWEEREISLERLCTLLLYPLHILSPSLLSEVILDYIQLLGLWVLSWHLLYFPTFHKVGWICHLLHFFVILRLSKN